jgi:pyruvate dehydrogenase E2 component (dihydrolipoamide acetyltransferase)
MLVDFKLPSLGADMEEGVLLEWKVKPGDRVKKGDIVAVIDTVKAAIDVEIFVNGIVEELLLQPDPEKKLPVGTVLARINAEESEDVRRSESSAHPGAAGQMPAAAPSVQAPARSGPSGLRVSPAARKRAGELNVDLSAVKGSGPSGEIGIADVEAAAKERGDLRGGFDKKTSMRKAIAAAMAKSWKEIPHYFLRTEVDLTRASQRLAQQNAERPIQDRILMASLLVKAAALALKDAQEFNGFYADGEFKPGSGIHIGFAIALREGGLIAPAILDCDQKTLPDLMKSINDLVERTRSLSLRGSEMTDATITVTSLGDLGASTVFGIIYPPQVALVGFGSMLEKAVSMDGQIVSRQMMDVTLSADHRQTDGRQGALFLSGIKEILENPEELFAE